MAARGHYNYELQYDKNKGAHYRHHAKGHPLEGQTAKVWANPDGSDGDWVAVQLDTMQFPGTAYISEITLYPNKEGNKQDAPDKDHPIATWTMEASTISPEFSALYGLAFENFKIRIIDQEVVTDQDGQKHWFEVTVKSLNGEQWTFDPELINKKR